MDDATFEKAVEVLRGVKMPGGSPAWVGRCPRCGGYMLFKREEGRTATECLGCERTDPLEEVLALADGKQLKPLRKKFIAALHSDHKTRLAADHLEARPEG